MNVETMRKWLYTVYNNATWHIKVDHMTNNQVVAVYYKFLEQGKFNKKNKQIPGQMKISDFIKE